MKPDAPDTLAHELLIDLAGIDAALLCHEGRLLDLVGALAEALGVRALGPPQVTRFPDTTAGPGGVTLLVLLSESHLALHSWPEHGALLVSVCCCRALPEDGSLSAVLTAALGAHRVHITRVARRLP